VHRQFRIGKKKMSADFSNVATVKTDGGLVCSDGLDSIVSSRIEIDVAFSDDEAEMEVEVKAEKEAEAEAMEDPVEIKDVIKVEAETEKEMSAGMEEGDDKMAEAKVVPEKAIDAVIKKEEVRESRTDWWTRLSAPGAITAEWCNAVNELGPVERRSIKLSVMRGKSRGDRAVLRCVYCDYTCAGLTSMRAHLAHEHGYREASIMTKCVILEKDREFLHCDKCGYEAEKEVTMINHQRRNCWLGHARRRVERR
jgi:hypothetical protein